MIDVAGDINKIDSQEDYKEFEEKILLKKGELDELSSKIKSIAMDPNFIVEWPYFLSKYMQPKYGNKAARYLQNLLEGSESALELIADEYKNEMAWFIYKHEDLPARCKMYAKNPHSLISYTPYSSEGTFALQVTRVDNKSFSFYFSFDEKVLLIKNLFGSLIADCNKYDLKLDEEEINSFEQIIDVLSIISEEEEINDFERSLDDILSTLNEEEEG
ncbi:hypothetical protein [Brevibacillus fortis]|uniref:hypothetical protein n=1 Tax=Brevibacillus fortis TaxID=2126352 RepID=UPI0038FCD199